MSIKIIEDVTCEIKNGKIVDDGNITPLLNTIKKHNIKYKVLNEIGPGGGWPEIEFEGEKEALIEMLYYFDSYGRSYDEYKEAMKNWSGNDVELIEIIH